jgi:hypothetical protein
LPSLWQISVYGRQILTLTNYASDAHLRRWIGVATRA